MKCLWISTGYNYDTSCGNTYFNYIKPDFQNDIEIEDGKEICPFCHCEIERLEEDEEY